MSCEVGAPAVRRLLPSILESIGRKSILRTYLKREASSDVEKVLGDLDDPRIWSSDLTRSEHKRVRAQLLSGIVRVFDKAYYEHLRQHFGLRRQDDPYYSDVRDYRVGEKVGKQHGLPINGSTWTLEARKQLARERVRLRDRKCLDEVLPPLDWELLPVARAVGRRVAWQAWSGGLESLNVSRSPTAKPTRKQLAKASQILLDARGDRLDPYHLLVALLLPGDTIITLNYDLFLDRALLERLGDPVTPAFAVGYGSTFIGVRTCNEHPYETWNGFRGWHTSASTGDDDAVVVLKLHGGIDWLQCPSCHRVSCTPVTPGSCRAIRQMLIEDKRLSDCQPCCSRYDPRALEPCLVAPEPRKQIATPSLSDIWDFAQRRLENASELIFIGCALGSADNHVRKLIGQACASARPRLLVVNRDLGMQLQRRYRTLAEILKTAPAFWRPGNRTVQPTASAWLVERFLEAQGPAKRPIRQTPRANTACSRRRLAENMRRRG
jgi:hypothetical protein